MRTLIIISLLLISRLGYAQDVYCGSWSFTEQATADDKFISIKLDIGAPEAGILYPAQLSIQTNNFSGSYQILLTKRNSRKLVFGKTKHAVTETPFSLKEIPGLFNGSLEFSKDIKGQPRLTVVPLPIKKMPSNPLTKGHAESATIDQLINICANGIEFKKIGENPWSDSNTILKPKVSPVLFGLTDTIFVQSKDGAVKFFGNKDNDIISILLNGKELIDQVDSKKTREDEEFILDTGLNILSFFCDDFGKISPSTAKIRLNFDKAGYDLDFKQPENEGAAVMSIKIYYQYNKEDFAKFEAGPSGTDFIKLYESIANKFPPSDSGMRRQAKLVGNITSRSQQLTFAIWDDAVEDGDTISLTINGKWIVQHFPVLKKPQFVTVTLQPGPNLITFVADNLGSIVPNTSVLEIIDGKKRKSYFIETDLLQNNLVNIFYDIRKE